jgi:uncharacterized membrane protein (DUF2068 family)
MPAAGPGPLAPVHRITIWTAFLGALAYLAFEVKQIVDGAPGASVVRVALALAAALAIAAYLKHLRARLADKLTPRGSA